MPVLWGNGIFGSGIYGGGLAGATPPVPTSHIPASPPFNLYNVTPGAAMAAFTGYIEVDLFGGSGQFNNDSLSGDLLVGSGGSTFPDSTAYFQVGTAVTDTFTYEMSVTFWGLPSNFLDLTSSHAFCGVSRSTGYCFGLFFSLAGIVYSGSVLFNGSNNLVLNSPAQLLPDSPNLVQEGKPYTIRVCVDSSRETTYIYITPSEDVGVLGHKLRYVLPSFDTSKSILPAPESGTYVSLKGTPSKAVGMSLRTISLGSGLLIPNIPPVADAGNDQGIRSCSIARLDGRGSFDPEGAELSYKWRLIDGPETSSFVYPGFDGKTYGSTLTNKLYSETLAEVAEAVTVVSGDVLACEGSAYNVVGTGTDVNGYYAQIDKYAITPGLTSATYTLLKQNSISGVTTAQPSFYPDVQGVFKFDLIVYDGNLYSEPSLTLLSVTDSPVPRGITPNVSFIWSYISDFWRLVENTEVIETFWGSLAQIAASELLTLWQYDYSKSLRDVQRTFQRKWLHYDLFIREPFPDLASVPTSQGSLQTSLFPVSGAPSALVGGEFVVKSPLFSDFKVYLTSPNSTISTNDLRQQLLRQLSSLDRRFSVQAYTNNGATDSALVISAPFPFSFSDSTSGLIQEGSNEFPSGDNGYLVAQSTYSVGNDVGSGESFYDLSWVQRGDYLVINGDAYEIDRVLPKGAWPGQRIVTTETLPLNAGSSWEILRGITSTYLDFYNSLCSEGDLAVFRVQYLGTGESSFVTARVSSAGKVGKTSLLVSTYSISHFLLNPAEYSVDFVGIHRRSRMPLDPLVAEIPTLQEKIVSTDDSEVLRQNVDFFIEDFRGKKCLRFVTSEISSEDVWLGGTPPVRMWAEVTYVDNKPTIESNFGIPAGFTLDDLAQLPSNVDYLSVVRGLWYTYFNGPTVKNLRAGTQILLGLPFAEEAGVIEEIRTDYSDLTGRILIRSSENEELVRSYSYPSSLSLELNPRTGQTYVVGDSVEQFDPLVTGVEVTDYISDPRWYEGYLAQGSFLEVDKFFRFLVRIDSDAFSLNSLFFVKSFIQRIKPTYVTPFYAILKKFDKGTTVDITDQSLYSGKLMLTEWLGGYSNDYDRWGTVGGAYDDPRAAFGGWRRRFDSDQYSGPTFDSPGAEPTYPTAISPIHWGFDREYLSPRDVIYGKITTVYPSSFSPAYDGLFNMDSVMFQSIYQIFENVTLKTPANQYYPDSYLAPPRLSLKTGTITHVYFKYDGKYRTESAVPLTIKVWVNNSYNNTAYVTIPAGAYQHAETVSISLPVTTADLLRVEVYGSSVTPYPGGAKMLAALGEAVSWTYDTTLPAGTYEKAVML